MLTRWAAHADALLPGAADDLVCFNRAIDQANAGSVARFSSISDNVIERHRHQVSATLDSQALAEASLRESEAKFRTIANAMPQMVWSALPNGFQHYYNQQRYDFTGVPPRLDRRRRLERHVPPRRPAQGPGGLVPQPAHWRDL